ncbi:MAG: PRD domain-containing protein, partial [Oscillibacter sp.]|nr:PRD domain-containing protein [Oscillibacter sp.]
MLTQRQLEILLELCENPGRYMTAAFFAQKQQVSLRTVQSDMRAIRKSMEQIPCVEYESMATKGSRVVAKDEAEFASLKDSLYQQLGNTTTSYQGERVNQLLLLLLNQTRPITYYDLENTVFVSRNTLLADMKLLEPVLEKYHLELMRSSNKVGVDGGEVNKRLCISEENLLMANPSAAAEGKEADLSMRRIQDILVETFVSFQHNISEVELSNMILILYVAVQRMRDHFFIDSMEVEAARDLHPEREMAEEVLRRMGDTFHLSVPAPEIDYLTLYMKGRGNADTASVITAEVDDLVLDGLREIRSAFGIDLTNDVNLRIALSLHCTQLMIRIRYDMQIKSHIVDYIRKTFPQGFDIATYFAAFLQKRFQKGIRDEEIAFIAIHLYKGLSDAHNSTGTRKILVISSLRRSENLLIRQTLNRWFADQIAELFFLPPSLMDKSYLDKYDVFLTTEKGKFYDMGLAFYVSPFPSQHDYLNLKLAMDGFSSIDDILQIFHRDLFEVFHQETTHAEALHTLCTKSSKFYHLDGLEEAVMEREN